MKQFNRIILSIAVPCLLALSFSAKAMDNAKSMEQGSDATDPIFDEKQAKENHEKIECFFRDSEDSFNKALRIYQSINLEDESLQARNMAQEVELKTKEIEILAKEQARKGLDSTQIGQIVLDKKEEALKLQCDIIAKIYILQGKKTFLAKELRTLETITTVALTEFRSNIEGIKFSFQDTQDNLNFAARSLNAVLEPYNNANHNLLGLKKDSINSLYNEFNKLTSQSRTTSHLFPLAADSLSKVQDINNFLEEARGLFLKLEITLNEVSQLYKVINNNIQKINKAPEETYREYHAKLEAEREKTRRGAPGIHKPIKESAIRKILGYLFSCRKNKKR
ncbi:MAG: hypothetical protein WC436_02415 [Candidatus Babeliales bacterium]